MDLSVVCQLVMTKDHIKTSSFGHIVLKESILPWRELRVEYIIARMTESQSAALVLPIQKPVLCRQAITAYQASFEHGVLRSEGNREGLWAGMVLTSMQFGSPLHSPSYELMGKDKLN